MLKSYKSLILAGLLLSVALVSLSSFNKKTLLDYASLKYSGVKDIPAKITPKDAEFITRRARESAARASAEATEAATNANWSSLQTIQAAENANSAYRDAVTYALALKQLGPAYQAASTTEEGKKLLQNLYATLLALNNAEIAKNQAETLATASLKAESFNTSPVGRISSALGLSKIVITTENGGEIGYTIGVNSLGGLGILAGGVTGFGSLGFLGNVTGSALGTSGIGQMAVSSSLGTQVSLQISEEQAKPELNAFEAPLGYDYSGLANSSNLEQTTTQCVSNYGAFCTSAPNSCGLVNPGRIGCAGNCTAITPNIGACTAIDANKGHRNIVTKRGEKCSFIWEVPSARYCYFHGTTPAGNNFNILTEIAQKFVSVSLFKRSTYYLDCYNSSRVLVYQESITCTPGVPVQEER